MKKKLFLAIVLGLLSSNLFVACGEKEKKEVAQNESSERGHMNVGLHWFGESMDPADGWTGWMLTRVAVGETLITIDEKMEVVGQLADSWENIDEKTWKLHIRQGVKFHNGTDLTPEIVKSSIERSMDLNERGKTNLKIESIETEGEYVVFKTKEPYGAFIYYCRHNCRYYKI